jgi:predicted nucleic acid-binding protein
LRKIVIADAGPLIAFARLHQIGLLVRVFESVMVTDEVFHECTCRSDFAETATIQAAFKNQLLQRCLTPVSHFELALHVDVGEASAIAAAVKLGCGVLMDDKAARRMANNFGLASIGTVGVLVLAKQKKLIPAVKPLLQQLTQTGYFLGDGLIAQALQTVGERE